MTTCTPALTPTIARTASASMRSLARSGALALVLVGVAVWSVSLSRSLFDPIGYDQGLYQYMAERVIAGDTLYVDVWDQNAPGIVAIHWLSTKLVGNSPMDLRVFDAIWQGLTLAALVLLGARDARAWAVGALAATLYSLAYYGMGYVHTAQREGFCVLPMLVMLHVCAEVRSASEIGRGHSFSSLLRGVVGGVCGFCIFAIKPPMGAAFGVLWLYAAMQGWRRRSEGVRAWALPAGLTLGFVMAAGAGSAWLVHAGAWDGFWGVLTRHDMPGYIAGPRLIRAIVPDLAAATLFAGGLAWMICRRSTGVSSATSSRWEFARAWVVIACIAMLLLTVQRWPAWHAIFLYVAAICLPAAGAVLVCAWRGRSEIERLCLPLLAASFLGLVLQGQFFLYHCPPIFALAAYLSAREIIARWRGLRMSTHVERTWLAVCLGSMAYLIVGIWWPTMTLVTAQPYVLAGTTLADHYTSITKHKLSCPTYATTWAVADRVQALTGPDDPIACLFHDMRVYYFCRRPAVYRLLPVQPIFGHMFDDYMQAITTRKPKVIIARVPESLRSPANVAAGVNTPPSVDTAAIASGIFAEAESYFGPAARCIRANYRVAEVIDDVAIMTLR